VLRDPAGVATRMIGGMSDVTAQRHLEDQLRQAQRLEAIGQLTGGVAHDFNNLLTVIIGNAELLALELAADPERRGLAESTLAAARRGAELTNRLLAFARRTPLEPRVIEVHRLIDGMDGLLRPTLGEHIEIEITRDPDPWTALVDPAQLEGALLNLAINARDAMPGGGRLTIATRNLDRVPGALAGELAPGRYVAICVTDTGIGMAPEILQHAFEPFFTTKPQGKGTGLGLAQLYGFARQSGGCVRLDSEEGCGTSVTLYLPATAAEAQTARSVPAEGLPRRRGRILLVDDDDDVRRVATAMVAELGYEVVTAVAGEEALGLLAEGGFELMVTDIAMPGMNGVELGHRARRLVPDLPILFASGYADVQTFGVELSDELVLRKPFRISEVAARLHHLLEAGPAPASASLYAVPVEDGERG
jgi:nitrogen-specific signal transduction histidine kinase/ActR/RegA family two-component response regulator